MEDGTYDRERQPITYSHGYQVGLWTKTTDAENIESVIDEIQQWEDVREFGVWTDPSTGEIFVEPCVWCPLKVTALEFARAYHQRAIWSWADMVEIEVR